MTIRKTFVRRGHVLRSLKYRYMRLHQGSSVYSLSKLILPKNRDAIRNGLLHRLSVFSRLGREVTGKLPILTAYTNLVLLTSRVDGSSGMCFNALPIAIGEGTCNERLKDFRTATEFSGDFSFAVAFVETPCIRTVSTSTGGSIHMLTRCSNGVINIRCGGRVKLTFRPRLSSSAQVRREFLRVVSKGWVASAI